MKNQTALSEWIEVTKDKEELQTSVCSVEGRHHVLIETWNWGLLWEWSGNKPRLHRVMCEMGMKCLDCGAELKAVRFRKALSPTDESLKLWDRIHSGEPCGRPSARGRPARRDLRERQWASPPAVFGPSQGVVTV